MRPEPTRFSLKELAEATGLSERYVRQLVTDGVLPQSLGAGRSRYFTTAHIELLERIKVLRNQRFNTAEIKQELEQSLAANAGATGTTWSRVQLCDGLELHIRAELPAGTQALADEIQTIAREWFGDER